MVDSTSFPFHSLQLKDKVLVGQGPHDKGIKVTNDGAEILKSIGVDLPTAKVLVGMLLPVGILTI